MTSPNPALVSQREAQPLPRTALLLLCAAYVLPGLFGREPWKNADITAFGYIVNIAQGKTPWLAPTVGGLPADGAILPYWIGAIFVKATSPWLDPALAARIPFALLLALTLVFTWYAAYHLARSESAQPLPFAFGGEAAPADYARAIADGALLALIACLGLLQLGHETTPELAQLAAVSLYLYGLAASPHRRFAGGIAAAIALPVLAASGAPSIALLLAVVGIAVAFVSHETRVRRLAGFIAVGAVLAIATAAALGAWADRLGSYRGAAQIINLAKMIAWFAWPTWLLVLWTLWRWRRQLLSQHIAVPLACAAALLIVWLAMAGSDRALMLALPPLALLAAFALPTLQRSTASAIDWFSVFFFTIAAATGWLFYAAMQLGIPAKLAANVAKLSPGYTPLFSLPALLFALAASLAWAWLVTWRTGRRRHPLWKSLVLPASGVALCWLIAMTLLLPPLDNARSYRFVMQRIVREIPAGGCVSATQMTKSQIVAFEYLGHYRVDAVTPAAATNCEFMVQPRLAKAPDSGWRFVGRERVLRSDIDAIDIYRRASPPG